MAKPARGNGKPQQPARKEERLLQCSRAELLPWSIRNKPLGQERCNLPSTAGVTGILQIKCVP